MNDHTAPTQSSQGSISDARLTVDPAGLARAAAELDRLADRMEQELASHGPSLTPAAAGRDEVSVAVAASFTRAAESMLSGGAAGVTEIRALAEALRAQASTFTSAEAESVAGLRHRA